MMEGGVESFGECDVVEGRGEGRDSEAEKTRMERRASKGRGVGGEERGQRTRRERMR